MRKLELLAPAGNADIAIQAISHGADAVYIGPPSHGARKSAANSLEDIRKVADFAHLFNSKVYVTLNTIILEHELRDVEKMIHGLYDAGADALIVQDMGILRMDIPPIALHASTQCDIRTPEKALFLQEAGFSQIVLARELSVSEISEICRAVTIPVETFVHGALCVSYSGRCSAGYACAGRSGNRGECPQICRQAFTLADAQGKIIAKDKFILSLKDFRADSHLEELIEAGVSSFKIEGRLKEAGYVKNVTAFYSRRLDEIIRKSNMGLERASYGKTTLTFTPRLEKSFNRGFTDYFLSGRADGKGIASMLTPKSLGEPLSDLTGVRPGDGLSYFDKKGNYCGIQVNGVKDGNIIGNRPFYLPKGTPLFRTSSVEWKKMMTGNTARRTLPLEIKFDPTSIEGCVPGEVSVKFPHRLPGELAVKPSEHRAPFEKLGNTPFHLEKFDDKAQEMFYPLSALTALRRELTDKLLEKIGKAYSRENRRQENRSYPYPQRRLDYRDNVANSLAESFYRSHGVEEMEAALETKPQAEGKGKRVMTTRHCILRETGMCLKEKQGLCLPLTLTSGSYRLQPEFDCSRCEMHLRLL